MKKYIQKSKEPFGENTEFILGPNADDGHKHFYRELHRITLKNLQRYNPGSGWCKKDIEERLREGILVYAKKING